VTRSCALCSVPQEALGAHPGNHVVCEGGSNCITILHVILSGKIHLWVLPDLLQAQKSQVIHTFYKFVIVNLTDT
jgi:hypothetical protein